MAEELYVGRGARKAGPFSPSQLRGLAAAGRLELTDTIWKEGMEKAIPIARVKNLFSVPLAHANRPAAVPVISAASPFPLPAADLSPRVEIVQARSSPESASLPSAEEAAALPEVVLVIGPLIPLDGEKAAPPEPEAKKATPSRPPQSHVRKMRALAVKGAILLGQDGVSVNYRKKCTKCGFEDACRSTLRIAQGVTRINFYCPKCKRSHDVQIQGIMS
jgi:hypothetical protein